MLTLRRLKQWLYALRLAGVRRVPWLGLLSAILSGPVPRPVWRARMRTCLRCPLYSKRDGVGLCLSSHPDMLDVGCGCYLAYTALWANPHPPGGCYGRSLDPDLGWGPYEWKGRGERVLAALDFLLYPPQDRNIKSSTHRNRPAI